MKNVSPIPSQTIKITVSVSDPDVIDNIENNEYSGHRGASQALELTLLATREANDRFHVDVSFLTRGVVTAASDVREGDLNDAGGAVDRRENARRALRTARLAAGLVNDLLSRELASSAPFSHRAHHEEA
jgi:hypothetical protein